MSGVGDVLCGLTGNDFVPLTQLLELCFIFLKSAQIGWVSHDSLCVVAVLIELVCCNLHH